MAHGAPRWIANLAVLAVLAVLCTGGVVGPASADVTSPTCPQALAQAIPPRPAAASTGSEFVRQTAAVSEAEREARIAEELLAGNLPSFLRRLKPVTLDTGLPEGRPVRITICVTPDYLALGSDEDFLRIPMGLETALTVAHRYGFILPTPKMVDAIYEQSEIRMRPQPLPPGDQMRSSAYYWRHESRIREQRRALPAPLGVLIAGQKKDLVITERLRRKPGRVAIYGWHEAPGQPIQPLSTVHGARYADYSHGVRLVSIVAFVDGQPRPILDLLDDPQLAPLLSDEGPIQGAAALVSDLGGQRWLAERRPSWPVGGNPACTLVC